MNSFEPRANMMSMPSLNDGLNAAPTLARLRLRSNFDRRRFNSNGNTIDNFNLSSNVSAIDRNELSAQKSARPKMFHSTPFEGGAANQPIPELDEEAEPATPLSKFEPLYEYESVREMLNKPFQGGAESDCEYFDDISGRRIDGTAEHYSNQSIWKRMLKSIMSQEGIEQLDAAKQRICASWASKLFWKFFLFVFTLISCVLKVMFKIVDVLRERICRMGCNRLAVREGARRILWCITLARGNDLRLYGLIIVMTPWLFLLAIVGFVVSIYTAIKERAAIFLHLYRLRLLF